LNKGSPVQAREQKVKNVTLGRLGAGHQELLGKVELSERFDKGQKKKIKQYLGVVPVVTREGCRGQGTAKREGTVNLGKSRNYKSRGRRLKVLLQERQ